MVSRGSWTFSGFQRIGEARAIDIETLTGQSVSAHAVLRFADLFTQRSGENFPVDDLVEAARLGHFEKATNPWEQIGPI